MDIRVAFAFGANVSNAASTWSFDDCTSDLLLSTDGGVSTRVSRSEFASQQEPNNAQFELKNLNGQYSVDDPMGANWPNVIENVPGVLAIRRNLNPTFETDVSDWTAGSGTIARSTVRAVSGVGSMLLTPTGGIATAQAAITTAVPCRPGGYLYVDAWIYSVAGWGSICVAVDWQQAGGTFISTTFGTISAVPAGAWTYFSGLIGPAPALTGQGVGKVRMSGTPASTDTLWIDEARTSLPRLCGYVDGWTPTIDTSGNRKTVIVSMSSMRRRLNQGNLPVRSPIRYTAGNTAMSHYWTLEDSAGSTQAKNEVATSTAYVMYPSGTVTFANSSPTSTFAASDLVIKYGTKPLVNLNQGGSLSSAFPVVGPTAWAVQLMVLFDASTNGAAEITIAEWDTPGGSRIKYRLKMSGGAFGIFGSSVYVIDANGAETKIINDNTTSSRFREIYVSAAKSGVGGVDNLITLSVDGGTVITTATISAATLAGITSLRLNPNSSTTSVDLVIGHVRVSSTSTPVNVQPPTNYLTQPSAYISWSGETAGARVARVLTENSLPAVTINNQANSVVMGPQPIDTVDNILDECETTDGGILYDQHDCFGTGYVVRSDLYNEPVTLSANYASGHIYEKIVPVHDDTHRINHVSVKNTFTGSTYEYFGDMSTGDYPRAISVNMFDDTLLTYVAQWWANIGTPRQKLRYPQHQYMFGSSGGSSLISSWAMTDSAGDRHQLLNPPDEATVNTIDLMVLGWSETLGAARWLAVVNANPYDPWRVFALASASADAIWRLGDSGSTLAAGVNSTATTLSVATSAGNMLWSTSAGDYPSDIYVDGERITVTAVTGSSSPQSFTVTRSTNGVVKSLASGAAVTLWRAPITAL